MKKFNYKRIKTTADKLIERYGLILTLKKTGATGDDPWDPGTGVTIEHLCKGVILEHEKDAIDGELVKVGDKRVLLSAQGLKATPDLSDKLVIQDKEYNIVPPLTPLAPSGETIMYTLNVRP